MTVSSPPSPLQHGFESPLRRAKSRRSSWRRSSGWALVTSPQLYELTNYLFPNIDQPFRIVTLGTVVAVIIWLAASLGFSFYVNNLASYSTLYGNRTAIIVLQLYIYISASIILFSAEVNEQIYREFAEEGRNGGEALQ